jgi:hypothetical protein
VLLEQRPGSAEQAVKAVLASAREVASSIGLRPNIEASHRDAVERVLDQLRSSAAHGLATRASGIPHCELTATLLYLVPLAVWDATPAPVSLELRALLDPERLPVELRAEISVLRQQLTELLSCRDDVGADCR